MSVNRCAKADNLIYTKGAGRDKSIEEQKGIQAKFIQGMTIQKL